MGRQQRVPDDGRPFFEEGREGDQDHGNDEDPLDEAEARPANPIDPPEISDFQDVFDDDPQDAHQDENQAEQDQEAEDVEIGGVGYPAGKDAAQTPGNG